MNINVLCIPYIYSLCGYTYGMLIQGMLKIFRTFQKTQLRFDVNNTTASIQGRQWLKYHSKDFHRLFGVNFNFVPIVEQKLQGFNL